MPINDSHFKVDDAITNFGDAMFHPFEVVEYHLVTFHICKNVNILQTL